MMVWLYTIMACRVNMPSIEGIPKYNGSIKVSRWERGNIELSVSAMPLSLTLIPELNQHRRSLTTGHRRPN